MVERKLNMITAFNSGEYSPSMSGRVDYDAFALSSRLLKNFIPEVQGGLKKFYGTKHISTLSSLPANVLFIPFDGQEQPIILVLYNGTIGVICGDQYFDNQWSYLNASADLSLVRWQKVNDKLFIVGGKNFKPVEYSFLGIDEYGVPSFRQNEIQFTEPPFYPIGLSNQLTSSPVFVTNTGVGDTIIMTTQSSTSTAYIAIQSEYKIPQDVTYDNGAGLTRTAVCGARVVVTGSSTNPDPSSVITSYNNPQLIIKKNGTTHNTISIQATPQFITRQMVSPRGGSYALYGLYYTKESIKQAFISAGISAIDSDTGLLLDFSNTSWLADGDVVSVSINEQTQPFTVYYATTVGSSVRIYSWHSTSVQQRTITFPNITVHIQQTTSTALYVGKYMKIYMNSDSYCTAWYQTRAVITGEYCVYGNNYYRAVAGGTCGNIAPTHTLGIRSDGGVNWEYMHSGYGILKITGAATSTSYYAKVLSNLPIVTTPSATTEFDNYRWSIFMQGEAEPDNVFIWKNRLGFTTKTPNGCYLTLSCTDDYYNFAENQYGEQLDTSAINILVNGLEDNNINWVIAGNRLYMGSYAGEFNINGPKNTGIPTPTACFVESVSTIGGSDVIASRYKDLNLFVGSEYNELYTIGYDYTTDDYAPTNIGFLANHLLDKRISTICGLNNKDKNIYMLGFDGTVFGLNYVKEQKILGYFSLDFDGQVKQLRTINAQGTNYCYIGVVRNNKLSIERFTTDRPNYMLSEHFFTPVVGSTKTTITIQDFANKTAWLRYGNVFREITFDANGVWETPEGEPITVDYSVGLPLECEFHSQPMFGKKLEGQQQKSSSFILRLKDSGNFSYGTSNDFSKYYPVENWNTLSNQNWGSANNLMTGDLTLSAPFGYTQNGNKVSGPYPNSTGLGLNIKADTPEPFNLLLISDTYI